MPGQGGQPRLQGGGVNPQEGSACGGGSPRRGGGGWGGGSCTTTMMTQRLSRLCRASHRTRTQPWSPRQCFLTIVLGVSLPSLYRDDCKISGVTHVPVAVLRDVSTLRASKKPVVPFLCSWVFSWSCWWSSGFGCRPFRYSPVSSVTPAEIFSSNLDHPPLSAMTSRNPFFQSKELYFLSTVRVVPLFAVSIAQITKPSVGTFSRLFLSGSLQSTVKTSMDFSLSHIFERCSVKVELVR